MNKTDKIIVIFYIVLAVSYVSAIIYIDKSFSDVKLGKDVKISLIQVAFVRSVDVNKTKIFNTMADVQDYPIVLPRNVVSVKIINQTNNVMYAEEELTLRLIKEKFLVKHTFQPYQEQTAEVMDGDAKGTKIVETFQGNDSATILKTQVTFHLNGLLSFLGYLPQSVIVDQLNQTMDDFVVYVKTSGNKYEKTIDDLYREILYRPADTAALNYYVPLLESGKITPEDIRKNLSESDEAKLMLRPTEMKTVAQLNDNTRKTIDDLYREILYRPADTSGLEYYGSLLEAGKIKPDEIRKDLLQSDEAMFWSLSPKQDKTAEQLNNTSRKTIDDLYREILYRPADTSGLEYYGSLLEAGKITKEDIRNSLYNSPEAVTTRVTDPISHDINDLYKDIFFKNADQQTLYYYSELLHSKNYTINDVKRMMLESDEAKFILPPTEKKTVGQLNNNTRTTVDDLYGEILNRPADIDGLEYYGSLLESGKMTQDDIKYFLSEEKNDTKFIILSGNNKTTQLSDETKNFINNYYAQTFGQVADPQVLEYYGSLLESGQITKDDFKNEVFNSPAALDMRFKVPENRAVDEIYWNIFHRHADDMILNHYSKLLQSKNMTLDDVKKDFLVHK